MSTNVDTPVASWNWLSIAYTANSYTFTNQHGDMAFYILAKPSQTMVVPWGDDTYGQCGDMPPGITNAIMVAGGYAYSLALLNDGTVVGWGTGEHDGYVPTNLVNVAMVACGWDAQFLDYLVEVDLRNEDAALCHGAFVAKMEIRGNYRVQALYERDRHAVQKLHVVCEHHAITFPLSCSITILCSAWRCLCRLPHHYHVGAAEREHVVRERRRDLGLYYLEFYRSRREP